MRRTARRAALLPALTALALVAAACSDDGDDDPTVAPPASSSAATTPAPATTEPSASATPSALTAAQAAAKAEQLGPRINLRAADLPGFTGEAPDAEDDGDDDDLPATALATAARCLGLTPAETKEFFEDDDDTGVASQDFSKGELPSLEFSSEVDVDDEGGVASAQFARFVPLVFSDRGAQCVGALFGSAIKDELGDTASDVRVVSSRNLTVTPGPGQRAGGVDVRIATVIQGTTVGFDFSFIVLFQGDVEVTLTSLGAGQPVPAAQQAALVKTLSTRLAAAA